MDDLISRQAVRNALLDLTLYKSWRELRYRCEESIADAEGWLGGIGECMNAIDDLPSAQSESFEWCHDCKEYDQTEHCCHRWTKVIRQTVEELKAQPERKKGKWIERNPQNSPDCRLIECSECGNAYIVGYNVNYDDWIDGRNFCMKCGADLRGGSNGKNT